MTRRARVLVAALFVLAVGASSGAETGFAQSSPDVDATFTVAFADGRSTYKAGELIPLVLEFTGRADPAYYYAMAETSTSRLDLERYDVTPREKVTDPLAEYFAAFPPLGGGVRGINPLNGSRYRQRVYLNEWVRFEEPGEYEVIVTSSRLQLQMRAAAPALKSNVVRLRIDPPDPDWALGEVTRAIAAIRERRPERAMEMGRPVSLAVREGVAVLRHLGTREAARALLAVYDDVPEDLHSAITMGLAASPHRAEIVQMMEARIRTEGVLPPRFIGDLSQMRVLGESSDGAPVFQRLRDTETGYNRLWLETILRSSISPAALASAIQRLERTGDETFASQMTDLLAAQPVAAAAAFASLPSRVQHSLLQSRWNVLNGAWMQPALERLYQDWRGDFRWEGAGDTALQRLAEMDPARAEAFALDEIRTGRRGIRYETLAALVTGPVPNLDDALLERYRGGQLDKAANTVWLMARYGSPSLLPFVGNALRTGLACEVEAGLIAYLLRHDATLARVRLSDFNRTHGCGVPPLSQIAQRHWDDDVEDVALQHLRLTRVSVVANAAQLLGRYGSGRVKQPLFDRLAQWEAEWRGRGAELDTMISQPETPGRVENFIVNALFENRSLILTDADVARIRALCVTDRCPGNVAALSVGRSTPIN